MTVVLYLANNVGTFQFYCVLFLVFVIGALFTVSVTSLLRLPEPNIPVAAVTFVIALLLTFSLVGSLQAYV